MQGLLEQFYRCLIDLDRTSFDEAVQLLLALTGAISAGVEFLAHDGSSFSRWYGQPDPVQRENELDILIEHWAPIGALTLRFDRVPTACDRARGEVFARRVADVVHRIQRVSLQQEVEFLQLVRVREVLAANDGNVSGTATELGVSRTFVYDVLRRGSVATANKSGLDKTSEREIRPAESKTLLHPRSRSS